MENWSEMLDTYVIIQNNSLCQPKISPLLLLQKWELQEEMDIIIQEHIRGL